MVIFHKRQQGSGSESDALSCSPSSFPETFDDLHAAQGKPVPPLAHCHGDVVIDELRIARARLERSYRTLRACAVTARENEERYDIGSYLDGVVDDLEYGGLDSMDHRWFRMRSSHVLETVLAAEEEEDEYEQVPEAPTWKDFRMLAVALGKHSEALRNLQYAERLAANSSGNADAMASPPLTPQDNAQG